LLRWTVKTVSATEAKRNLSRLLAGATAGETFVITKRGIPVARLEPVECTRFDFADAAAAIEEWERYRKEHNVTLGEGITIRELIEEGRM
jgi:prevent-host-death family protein